MMRSVAYHQTHRTHHFLQTILFVTIESKPMGSLWNEIIQFLNINRRWGWFYVNLACTTKKQKDFVSIHEGHISFSMLIIIVYCLVSLLYIFGAQYLKMNVWYWSMIQVLCCIPLNKRIMIYLELFLWNCTFLSIRYVNSNMIYEFSFMLSKEN